MPNNEKITQILENLDLARNLEKFTDKFNTEGETFIREISRFVNSYDVIFFILDHENISKELKEQFVYTSNELFGSLLDRVFDCTDDPDNQQWKKLLEQYSNPSKLAKLLDQPRCFSANCMKLNLNSNNVELQKEKLKLLFEKIESDKTMIEQAQSDYRNRIFDNLNDKYDMLSPFHLCVMVNCDPWLYYAITHENNPLNIDFSLDDSSRQRINSDLKILLSVILKPEFLSFISQARYPNTYGIFDRLNIDNNSTLTREDVSALSKELKDIEQSGLAVLTNIIKITLGILAFMTVIPALCIQIFSEQGFESMFFSGSRQRTRALDVGLHMLDTIFPLLEKPQQQ